MGLTLKLILQSCNNAKIHGWSISDVTARAIAGEWYTSEGGALYLFASIGTYHRDELMEEWAKNTAYWRGKIAQDQEVILDAFTSYLENRMS